MIDTSINTAQVLAQLNALSDDLKQKAVKAGVAKVAASGVLLLKQKVPVLSGDVQKSLGRKTLSARDVAGLGIGEGVVAMLAGPNRKVRGRFRSRIANVLEGGSKAHMIQAGKSSAKIEFMVAQGMRKKAKVLGPRNGHFFGSKVNHPGISPRPFIRESDAALGANAEGLFYKGVSDFLNRNRTA